MVINKTVKVLQSKKTYSLGVAVGIATYAISWVVKTLGLVDVLNIGGQATTTGALSLNLGTTASAMGSANALGVRVMAILTSIPNFDPMILIQTILGSILLIILGRVTFAYINFPKVRGMTQKLAIELLYGALWATILIAGIGGVGVSAVVTLGLYYLGLAIVVNLLTRLKFFARLVRE